jgi:hypothetical protein
VENFVDYYLSKFLSRLCFWCSGWRLVKFDINICSRQLLDAVWIMLISSCSDKTDLKVCTFSLIATSFPSFFPITKCHKRLCKVFRTDQARFPGTSYASRPHE